MTKTIGIFVEFNYEDLELWYPKLRFEEEGYKVLLIGPSTSTKYTSKHGYPAQADVNITQVTTESLDCLIIPGGWAPDYWRRDKRFVDLTRNMVQSGKLVGTICHGAWMLCTAKCLTGRKVTCFHAISADVENAGAIYEDKEVVEDENLITSRIPADLPYFCKAILQKLR